MKEVASLHYGGIFKKAFSVPAIFTAFVCDVVGVQIEIDHVETEKQYTQPEIKQNFNIIEKDLVTPDECARMFEESHQEELKRASFAEGQAEGRTEQALASACAMVADGLPSATMAKYTGLAVADVEALLKKQ